MNNLNNNNQVNLIRISKNNNNLKQFPRRLRLLIAEISYKLLNQHKSESDEIIIKKLILYLVNKELYYNEEIVELSEKLRDNKYRTLILTYIHNILKITRYLMRLNYSKEKIIIKNIVSELFTSGLNLGLSKSYLKDFISKVIKKFNKSLEDFNIRIKNSELTYNDLKRIAKSRKGELLSTKQEFESSKGYKSHTQFLWMCENGHKFWLTPTKINQGSWCPEK